MSEFSTNVQKFIVNVEKMSCANIRKLGFFVLRNVVNKTPEDTGMARMNWRCTLNNIDTSADAPAKKGRDVKIDEVPPMALGDAYHVTNALPYINRLDNGWSNDSPNGMTGPTLQAVQAVLDSGVLDKI